MTLQVAYESKFSESCSRIIYCAERTAYTWQRAVETELCSNGSLQAGAALKLPFVVSVQTEGVGGGLALPLLSCPLFVLLSFSRRTPRQLADLPGALRGASQRQLLQVSVHVRMS